MTSPKSSLPAELLTRRQVAAWLGVSVATIKRWDRSKKLHPRKLDIRTVRYDRADVARFISEAAAYTDEATPVVGGECSEQS